MPRKWVALLFCASVLYLTLFYQLGRLAFVGADEPRYARIGEEMNLSSNYVTPTLNFRPWLEKPPLLFWLEAGSFRLFGVQEWSARLPGALLSLFSLLLMAWLTLDVAGPRAALMNALILSTSGLYFVYARAASTDSLLAATLTASLFCGFQATRNKSSLLWAAGLGIWLGLATLAKGPVAVVLLVGIFGSYFLLIKQVVWARLQILVASLLFLMTAIPWFWEVWKENGYSFVSTFWINHHLARFLTDIHHHSQPFWYYLVVLALGFFPWVVFLGSATRRLWQTRGQLQDPSRQYNLFLWLCVIIPMVFFSASTGKLPGYILPVFPPLAAIVALEWESWLQKRGSPSNSPQQEVRTVFGFGLVLGSVLLAGAHLYYGSLWLGAVLTLPLLAGLGWARVQSQRGHPQGAFLTLVATMTLFASLTYWQAAPVVEDYHSARDLSRWILPRISEKNPLLLYRYFHHTAHYYTRYQAIPEPLGNLVSLRDYLEKHPQDRYYLLTQGGGWRDLQDTAPRLLAQQGNLYLVEIEPPLIKNRSLVFQYANSLRLWGSRR